MQYLSTFDRICFMIFYNFRDFDTNGIAYAMFLQYTLDNLREHSSTCRRTNKWERDLKSDRSRSPRGRPARRRRSAPSLRNRASVGALVVGSLQGSFERLYRSQILQVNMRLKTLAEIYTMHSFAQP